MDYVDVRVFWMVERYFQCFFTMLLWCSGWFIVQFLGFWSGEDVLDSYYNTAVCSEQFVQCCYAKGG